MMSTAPSAGHTLYQHDTPALKGTVHLNIENYFTHPCVVSNLHEFISSAQHKRLYFEEF